MQPYVADGRARVVREIRAAAPLMTAVVAPPTARGPWLTAALNAQCARAVPPLRVRAVVVAPEVGARPDGLALLTVHRRGPTAVVGLLGSGPGAPPLPAGRPPARLLARDPEVAEELAGGVLDLLDSVRGAWTLRLAGLPLGDPVVRRLAAALPDAQLATGRSRRLVDELDTVAEVRRSRDPGELERWLPALAERLGPREFVPVRAAARLHAAIGRLELAVVPAGAGAAAVLLTLLTTGPAGEERWPWWGVSDVGGLRRELGSPSVSLTASRGLVNLTRRGVSRGTAPR
ncbi:hypothetical protein [Modestobacter roseus]|uniref:Uncharacterized protein n=1 Tax=Modestobacter roseus TaxID=1181884 RepID=A0A562ITL1_9ACTN|nr:hypothetical protein [Modestobacter roseus]MQA33251.1 hypothetical protein [Modestobacter roseus]TWH74176.1 hypothetical protein JD78_02711 [Modestobacter roseus]